jgi:dihydropteroate synthase-like protein
MKDPSETPLPDRPVLVLTGRICYPSLKSLLKDTGAEVFAGPVDVAALMTNETVRTTLEGKDLDLYSYVMLPGMFGGDLLELEGDLGIEFFLGPVNFTDIPIALQHAGVDRLSKRIPANRILMDELTDRVTQFYRDSLEKGIEREGSVVIGDGASSITIYPRCPPRIVAEIVDASDKGYEEIVKEAKHYMRSGADIVDLGLPPGPETRGWISDTLPQLAEDIKAPISVDTLDEAAILSSADAGADLILSLCGTTLELVESIDTPVVLVPVADHKHRAPRRAEERLERLAEYQHQIEGHAAVLDPLLEPIGNGFDQSIKSYLLLEDRFPRLPSMMGIGNVTELTDVDSIGMNGLLAGIASACGTSLMLSTENSQKTRGSISELSNAAVMMYYSVSKSVAPKDIGLDLLYYKEKTPRIDPTPLPGEKMIARSYECMEGISQETKFHIIVRDSSIHVITDRGGQPVDITGRNSDEIIDTLGYLNLLPSPRHCAYLGQELAKAEIALLTGRSYMQDQPLFSRREAGV